jgi:hypothetical protein
MEEDKRKQRHKEAEHGNIVRMHFLRKGNFLGINYISTKLIRHLIAIKKIKKDRLCGQSSWLQIQRSGFHSHYQIF